MKTSIEGLWEEAIRQAALRSIEEHGLHLMRLPEIGRHSIFAGVDASLSPLLAIGTQKRPPSLSVSSSAFDYFRQERINRTWLMILRLRSSVGLGSVFGKLCQDLVDASRTIESETGLVELFQERLTQWENLFAQTSNGLLQLYQIKGLFAELLILKDLIESGRHSISDAVRSWTGPLGSDQDFIFANNAIEVKAIHANSESVGISSLAQLASTVPIVLALVELRESSEGERGSFSLNQLIASIEELVAREPELLKVFRERLLSACYVEHSHYDSILLQGLRRRLFDVEGDFPRLTPDNVMSGVEAATYKISLRAIERFERKVDKGEYGE